MNRQQEALRLAEELLADIELDRIGADKILLKGVRLARLIDDSETLEWMHFELHGYTSTELGEKFMTRTRRWINKETREGYWGSFAGIKGTIDAYEKALASMQSLSLSGESLVPALNNHLNAVTTAAQGQAKLASIVGAVIAEIHQFTVRTYHSLLFSEAQESLFTTVRHDIDSRLAPLGGEHLEKIESINERLRARDPEAVSQAMNTCRRLIDNIADTLFPPSDEPFTIGDQVVSVKANNVLNRIQAYLVNQGIEGGRKDRLRRTMKDIYDRVSAGVHSDVTINEARYLFLQTYIALGEIMSLSAQDRTKHER